MARCESYSPGQCTAGACGLAGWIPEGLGDGGDWAADYQAQGGQVTMVPTAGAVVCYCRGGGYSEFGHVGLVLETYRDGTFLVREENFLGAFVFDDRRSGPGDVCGFLLAPGMAPGARGPGRGQGGPPGSGLQLPGQVVSAWEAVRWWSQQGYANEQGRQAGTERGRQAIPL
jgi:hypothetical protein